MPEIHSTVFEFRHLCPQAMFTSQLKECHDREVTLKDIEPTMLETLLQFAYTGSVTITQANVQSLMAASNLLQVRGQRSCPVTR